ncbi:sigma-70 family RNA polymerase sigma factor [Streptomyces sp. XY431]|uniref:sigma-70 family RNA polymerase sigma factor n=1 Tax=Streptomyces sp. XY431 TaxID=1415562 RepID=UPI0006AFBADF|nr:sigma-70 family RNA polymerase sigma factor [Streptomyces sp. XY431]
MDGEEFLAARFEEHRPHLRAVAYRMLGSLSEAEDAVQEAWFKLSRSDVSEVANLAGWLTTVVGRVCLDLLRSRVARREDPLEHQEGQEVRLPDPVIGGIRALDPEQEILTADSVGIALMIVLETLAPAERLSFVLHDMFSVPFDEIAPILGRTSASTRQLASRARRRVQGAAPAPDADLALRREVVRAFLTAARGGDFEALLAVLDPDVVARSDGGTLRPATLRRGATEVATGASLFGSQFAGESRMVLVNGEPAVATFLDGRPISLAAFTVRGGRVVGLDIFTDPERLERLGLSAV